MSFTFSRFAGFLKSAQSQNFWSHALPVFNTCSLNILNHAFAPATLSLGVDLKSNHAGGFAGKSPGGERATGAMPPVMPRETNILLDSTTIDFRVVEIV